MAHGAQAMLVVAVYLTMVVVNSIVLYSKCEARGEYTDGSRITTCRYVRNQLRSHYLLSVN
jgi:hypothetical protein